MGKTEERISSSKSTLSAILRKYDQNERSQMVRYKTISKNKSSSRRQIDLEELAQVRCPDHENDQEL